MMSLIPSNLLEFEQLAVDHSKGSIDKLVQALLTRDNGTYDKHIIPYLASRALLYKGPIGVEALFKSLSQAPGHIYPMAIISCLFNAAEGQLKNSFFYNIASDSILSTPLDEQTRKVAYDKFIDFLDNCRADPESFYQLISFLHHELQHSTSKMESYVNFHQMAFRVFSDSVLRISNRHIEQFKNLLHSKTREEEYQIFLTKNPVFLDPLASQLISKQKLGSDFITDYVLERITGDYIAVEIEKPQDLIFTKNNNFSSNFIHAFGQVLDFIEWIEQNISYAQKKLPNIASPKGLLVIGMRENLTPIQENKLQRFNRNSNNINVLTFDDLLSNAETLQHNIRHRVEFLSEGK